MKQLMKQLGFFLNSLFFVKDFFESKVYPGFKIKKGELVVDLGSGDKPFWRADVFLDKLSLGDEQRFSSSGTISDLGLFVDADLTKTPFKNKAFDFSFCSHVLEHVEKPELVIKEIVRISKQGYIEIPDGIIEVMSPYQSHLWFVFLSNNELVFLRQSKKIHEVLVKNGSKYSYLAKFIREPFIRIYWKKNIKYKVVDDLKVSEKFISLYDGRHTQPKYIQRTYLTLIKLLRIVFYKKKEYKILKERVFRNR